MGIRRRDFLGFLSRILLSLPLIKYFMVHNTWASRKLQAKAPVAVKGSTIQVKNKDEILVKGGCLIELPQHPKLNDSIYFVVTSENIFPHASVLANSHPIMGEREDLILNALGNFNLVYRGKKSGWVLS